MVSRTGIGLVLASLTAPLVLSACGGPQKSFASVLGLEKRAPDEFRVVERAPLTEPPDYNLRPPEPGAVRPQEGTPTDRARRVLTGNRLTPTASSGQGALLAEAGAFDADPNIRSRLLSETTALADIDEDKFWIILDFQRRRSVQRSGVNEPLNPDEEAARLAAAGVPVRIVTSRTQVTPIEPGS
ncbi:MAG: DUF3035 domain-containing protein [Geminicoccaceae bacterium]